MNKLIANIFMIMVCFPANSQVLENDELQYSFAPILMNLMDTNLTLVSASIQVQSLQELCTSSTIHLNSNNHHYSAHSDSGFQFNFGFIQPGKYKLSLISQENHSNSRVLINKDSITLERGSIYELKAIKGKFNPDTCCFAGTSFIIPIYFDLDKADLDSIDKIVLFEIFKTLMKYNLKVEIGVHFDDRFNRKFMSTCLSCRRADTIRNYLISLGTIPKNISAKGYESTKPYFLNARTDEHHAMNRRIEVTIMEQNVEK